MKLTLLAGTHAAIRGYLGTLAVDHAPASRGRRLASIKSFYKYLLRQKLLPASPAKLVKSPKLPKSLPKVLPVDEVFAILDMPSLKTVLGLRDRAILEILYGGGLRISELCGLNLLAVDRPGRIVRVMGKGSKERLCPVNAQSIRSLEAYLARRGELLATARRRAGSGRALPQLQGRAAHPAQHRPAPGHVRGAVRADAQGKPARAAPLVRHAPAGRRRGCAQHPGTAGAREPVHHPALYPRHRGAAPAGLRQGSPPA